MVSWEGGPPGGRLRCQEERHLRDRSLQRLRPAAPARVRHLASTVPRVNILLWLSLGGLLLPLPVLGHGLGTGLPDSIKGAELISFLDSPALYMSFSPRELMLTGSAIPCGAHLYVFVGRICR